MSKPKPTYLKDYKPSNFLIDSCKLEFQLHNDYTEVTSQIVFNKNPHTDSNNVLVLNGRDMELQSIHLNDRNLTISEYKLTKDELSIDNVPDEFTLQIVITIKPQDKTDLTGLYKSNQLFCTQCEPHGFRKITYFLDRPDILCTFEVRIEADKSNYPVLLSNGNLLGQGDAEHGRHWVSWQDPHKKPSYLFALVAGNLEHLQGKFITCSDREITLRVYVEPGNVDKAGYALHSLQQAMRWDEKVYGCEYDLDIFNIVAVSDFNMGAMGE